MGLSVLSAKKWRQLKNGGGWPGLGFKGRRRKSQCSQYPEVTALIKEQFLKGAGGFAMLPYATRCSNSLLHNEPMLARIIRRTPGCLTWRLPFPPGEWSWGRGRGAGPGNVPSVSCPIVALQQQTPSWPQSAGAHQATRLVHKSKEEMGKTDARAPLGNLHRGQMGSTVARLVLPKEHWLLNNLTFLFKIWTTVGHRNVVLCVKFPSCLIFCGLRLSVKRKSKEEKSWKKGKSSSTALSNHPFLHPPLSWTLCYPK